MKQSVPRSDTSSYRGGGGGYASRRQLILEAGVREDNSPGGFDAVGLAVQFQQAIGRRTIFIIDGFFLRRTMKQITAMAFVPRFW